MCSEWEDDFKTFYDWAVSHGYSDDLTLDRIDNDGNYCPENCQWVTNRRNCLNRGTSVLLTVQGETLNASVWAERVSISPFTLYWWCRTKGVEYAQKRIEERLLGGISCG